VTNPEPNPKLAIFCRYCGCRHATVGESWQCHCGRAVMFDQPEAQLQMRREWVGTDEGPIYPEPITEVYLRA